MNYSSREYFPVTLCPNRENKEDEEEAKVIYRETLAEYNKYIQNFTYTPVIYQSKLSCTHKKIPRCLVYKAECDWPINQISINHCWYTANTCLLWKVMDWVKFMSAKSPSAIVDCLKNLVRHDIDLIVELHSKNTTYTFKCKDYVGQSRNTLNLAAKVYLSGKFNINLSDLC